MRFELTTKSYVSTISVSKTNVMKIPFVSESGEMFGLPEFSMVFAKTVLGSGVSAGGEFVGSSVGGGTVASAAGEIAGAETSGDPNICTTRVVSMPSSLPSTTAIPMSLYLGLMMLLR